jgi:hypothetical protein
MRLPCWTPQTRRSRAVLLRLSRAASRRECERARSRATLGRPEKQTTRAASLLLRSSDVQARFDTVLRQLERGSV